MQHVPYVYKGLYGCLNYVAECRPDIKGALSILGRFLCNPGRTHWKALKRVMIYLKSTKDLGP